MLTNVFGQRDQNFAIKQSIDFSQGIGKVLVQCQSTNLLTLDLHFRNVGRRLRLLLLNNCIGGRIFCFYLLFFSEDYLLVGSLCLSVREFSLLVGFFRFFLRFEGIGLGDVGIHLFPGSQHLCDFRFHLCDLSLFRGLFSFCLGDFGFLIGLFSFRPRNVGFFGGGFGLRLGNVGIFLRFRCLRYFQLCDFLQISNDAMVIDSFCTEHRDTK